MIEVLYVFQGGEYEGKWRLGGSSLIGNMGAEIGFKVIGDKPISLIKFYLTAYSDAYSLEPLKTCRHDGERAIVTACGSYMPNEKYSIANKALWETNIFFRCIKVMSIMIQYKDGSRKTVDRSDIVEQLKIAESTLDVPENMFDDDVDADTFEKMEEEYTRKFEADVQKRASEVPSHHKYFDNHTASGGGCYIATCVYGSYDCPEVWTLRRYRDFKLAESVFGRQFIKIYYAISPKIVSLFGNKNWFRKMCKGALDPMVKRLHNNGFNDTPYYDR